MKFKLKSFWRKPVAAGQARPKRPGLFDNQLISTAAIILCAVLIAVFTKAYLIQPYVVDGHSMETTLQNNDHLLVDKIPRTLARLSGHPYIPARGDIIIFDQTGLPGLVDDKKLIKRVIGLPGDHIIIQAGQITIFNKAHPKGFNPDISVGYHLTEPNNLGQVNKIIGLHQVFVCGDNRNNSEDSRFFGPIDASQIVGKLVLRITPLNKVQAY